MNIVYILVFYVLNASHGYVDKNTNTPQFVSGPYSTEAECTEHQASDTKPQVAEGEGENRTIRDYECIAEFDLGKNVEEL